MTKITKNVVKCAVCGAESEQMFVHSVNYLMGSKEDNDALMNSKQKCPNCGYENSDISKIDGNLEKVSELLKLTKEETIRNSKKIDEITTYYWNPNKGGVSIIVGENGNYLAAASSISFEKLLEEFQKGGKNRNFQVDEKRKAILKKVDESKNAIVYLERTIKPTMVLETNIIIVDDIIYKSVNGRDEFLENQKETVDKVWNYVNLMQGIIRTEVEKQKQRQTLNIKVTSTTNIAFKINGEQFDLTSRISMDENDTNLFYKIIKDILEIVG